MSNEVINVLVAYGSKHGATFGIAEAIGEELTARGLETTVIEAERIDDLSEFDAAVVGSSVYAGHWNSGVKDFVSRNSDVLMAMPVWLFSSGPLGDPLKPDEEPVDVSEIQAATDATDHQLFGGALDKGKLNFAERAIVRAFKAPEGDFRQWDEIKRWADEIAAQLTSPVTAE